MRKSTFVPLIICFIIFFSSCCKEKETAGCSQLPAKTSTVKIEHSLKGWELYSWPGNDCDGWNFVLLPGTNLIKSFSAVTSDSNLLKVTGEKQLELLLEKFPENEQVLWVGEGWLSVIWGQGRSANLKLPPAAIQRKVKEYCSQQHLELTITP